MSGEEKAPRDDFNLLVSAVFEIQKSIGEQMHAIETLSKNADQGHKDFEEMRHLVSKISHTVYAAGVLLTVLGGVAAWLIEKIWTVLLPYLQAKGQP